MVGRDEVLRQLRHVLLSGSGQALSIVGKGGVGKTALATALARNAAVINHFSGGVLWARVGPTPNIDDILEQWAAALGANARMPDTMRRVQLVQNQFRGQPFLIVLDDVWQWGPAYILRQVDGPGCVHLLTTRDSDISHRFAPEHITIGELDTEQAVKLLVSLWPEASLAEEQSLSSIAQAVGGLPLALTLIGGYLAGHSTFQADAQEALNTVERTSAWLGLEVEDRQLPLVQVIGLSVDALPNEQTKAAFVAQSPFAPKPESFSLDAAMSVSGSSREAIGMLVQRNLLEKLDDDRLTLHQAISAVALDMAGTSLPLLRVQHLGFYLSLMKRNPYDWKTIEQEWPQICFAWNWVSNTSEYENEIIEYLEAVKLYQAMRTRWHELVAWSARGVIAARRIASDDDEAALLHNMAWAYNLLGQQAQALQYYQQSLVIRQRMGDRVNEALTLTGIGGVYHDMGDARTSLSYHEQALLIQQEAEDLVVTAAILNNAGFAHKDLGDLQMALHYYEQALSIRRKIGDLSGEATTLNNIGNAHRDLGEAQQALAFHEQALHIRRQLGNRSGEAITLRSMGLDKHSLGDRDAAIQYCEQALHISEESGDAINQASTLSKMATIFDEKGDYSEAASLLERAIRIGEPIQHPDLESDRVRLEEVRHKLTKQ